jgi:hypothetical protein
MKEQEDGVSQAVIERFVEQRLPELMKLEQKVDAGESLDDGELDILERLVESTRDFGEFVGRYPQYEDLVARIASLYEGISSKALDIERQQRGED